MVRSAWRLGKLHRDGFHWGIGLAGVYVLLVFCFLASIQAENRLHEQAAYLPPAYAHEALVSLTSCLLRNHSQHPEFGYPRSLDPAPPNWVCSTKFGADAFPEYTFAYIPRADESSGSVADFQLSATPLQPHVQGWGPWMTDSRGIVFSGSPGSGDNPPGAAVVDGDLVHSRIVDLSDVIQQAMKEGTTPDEIKSDTLASLGLEQLQTGAGGRIFRSSAYELHYSGPDGTDMRGFAISARCQSYGEGCLRSYFLDYDGVLHGTGEPREATAKDPVVPECEYGRTECKDISILE